MLAHKRTETLHFWLSHLLIHNGETILTPRAPACATVGVNGMHVVTMQTAKLQDESRLDSHGDQVDT
jgi:hypothetical protein